MIPTVNKSAKAAETRALDACCDNAIEMARVFGELVTGKRGNKQIPVDVKVDNLGMKESLESTKQVEERLMRPIIRYLKDLKIEGKIRHIDWISTKNCLADVMTKKNSPASELLLKILETGDLS